MSKNVPFQPIQFSISTQFECKYSLIVKTFLFQAIQFSRTIQCSLSTQLVLFNPYIGPYPVLPFQARVDLGAMVMRRFSVFPEAAASLEPHHQIV